MSLRKQKSRRKENNPDTQKIGNWGFLLAVPSVFLLACLSLIVALVNFEQQTFELKSWAIFGGSFVLTLVIVISAGMHRLRTLIHELKHAILIVVTGNDLQGMKVGKYTGHVNYQMRGDRLQYGPIITLAPYFLPLFSCPLLIASIVLESTYRLPCLFGLGIALAFDLATNIYELHPNQTDLKAIRGGFIVAGSFLAGANAFWVLFCLNWVIGGRAAYVVGWHTVYSLGLQLLASAH